MKSINKNFNKTAILGSSGGFTILETLVAIFILTLVISVSMGALQQSLQSSAVASDQIVAYNLAEEGIEYVRAVRDSNTLNSTDWLSVVLPLAPSSQPLSLTTVCGGTNTCRVDAVNGDSEADHGIQICGGSSGLSCQLLFDGNSGSYNYKTGGPSRFSRAITVTPVGTSGNEVLVTVVVTWSGGRFSNESYTLSEEMYNWE